MHDPCECAHLNSETARAFYLVSTSKESMKTIVERLTLIVGICTVLAWLSGTPAQADEPSSRKDTARWARLHGHVSMGAWMTRPYIASRKGFDRQQGIRDCL
jgi:hypothetical protein